jgi:hypothetical protein
MKPSGKITSPAMPSASRHSLRTFESNSPAVIVSARSEKLAAVSGAAPVWSMKALSCAATASRSPSAAASAAARFGRERQ